MSTKQLADKGYTVFSTGLEKSEYNRTKFFKELSKKGYNSVIDQNDIHLKVADLPLIVFSGNKSLVRTGARKMSDLDITRVVNEFNAK